MLPVVALRGCRPQNYVQVWRLSLSAASASGRRPDLVAVARDDLGGICAAAGVVASELCAGSAAALGVGSGGR